MGYPHADRLFLGHGNGSRRPEFERLIATETDDCVIWPYAKDRYGRLMIAGVVRGVHVWSCERAHGPAPAGCEVAHSCGNTRCINQRHLRWDTGKGNAADRHRHGTHLAGERCPAAKLSGAAARRIRERYRLGRSQVQLAETYGVSQSTISRVVRREVWK